MGLSPEITLKLMMMMMMTIAVLSRARAVAVGLSLPSFLPSFLTSVKTGWWARRRRRRRRSVQSLIRPRLAVAAAAELCFWGGVAKYPIARKNGRSRARARREEPISRLGAKLLIIGRSERKRATRITSDQRRSGIDFQSCPSDAPKHWPPIPSNNRLHPPRRAARFATGRTDGRGLSDYGAKVHHPPPSLPRSPLPPSVPAPSLPCPSRPRPHPLPPITLVVQ